MSLSISNFSISVSISTNIFQRKEPEHGIPDYMAEPKDCGKSLNVLADVNHKQP